MAKRYSSVCRKNSGLPAGAADGAEEPRFALDHAGCELLPVRGENDVHLWLAPRLPGLEPDIERRGGYAIDDVLSRFVRQIGDANANTAMPARVAARACGCADLFEELLDVQPKIEVDFAESLATHDDLFFHEAFIDRRIGLR